MSMNNNLNFKYVWLNSGEIVHSQSRGLSLEICGYLPISLGNKENYLADMIGDETGEDELLNLGNTLVNYKTTNDSSKLNQVDYPLTFIFPGMSYNSNGKYILSNVNPEYKEWLANYEKHLFTNIKALNTTEMKFVGSDDDTGELGNQNQVPATGSIQISFDINNQTFGTAISNDFYIDAIMLFGQAFNDRSSGNDLTQEQQLQKIVPLGLIVYSDSRESVSSSSEKFRPFIQPGKMSGVVQRETLTISLVQGDFNLQAFSNDANFKQWQEYAGRIHLVNDNLTTSAKFLLVGNKLTTKALDSVTGIDELSGTRTFASCDRLYMADFENNFDDCNDDFSSPAMITCMTSAEAGFKNPQIILGQVTKDTGNTGIGNIWDGIANSYWTEVGGNQSGSMYNIDWIGPKRPGINFLSNELSHYNTATSAFGGGIEILSNNSFTSRYSTNILGENNTLRGVSLVMASKNVNFYQSGFNSAELSASIDNNYSTGEVYINSTNLDVSGAGKDFDFNTVIGSDNISIVDRTNSQHRNTIINTNSLDLIDVNSTICLNVKGTVANNNYYHSRLENVSNSIVANGYNRLTNTDKAIVIGKNNLIVGSLNGVTKNCKIIGDGNKITSIGVDYGDAKDITLFGRGLHNDINQQIFERSNDGVNTLVLGEYNNEYTKLGNSSDFSQLGPNDSHWTDYSNSSIVPLSIKQVVIGGWKPSTTKSGITNYNMAEFSVDNTTLNDSILGLADVKGRMVEYTSRGLNVSVQSELNQDNFNTYNYKKLGGINWAKLICLLKHLNWDPTTNTVKYTPGVTDFDEQVTEQVYCNYYDALNGSTNLYDLISNSTDAYPLPN